MNQIVIEVKETNPFKITALKKQLETLANLDGDTMNKLVEVAKSEKLIAMFKDNWELIKMM
jgi:hypothetical protein